MQGTTVYLNFDGNCREAMEFYHHCLGGDLQVMTFGDSADQMDVPPGSQDRVMHAAISKGPMPVLMASDTMPGTTYQQGNSVWVMAACEADDELDGLFAKLVDGGTSLMEPNDTFWGARFAMLTDRFGINWMFNHQKNPAG